MHVLLNDKPVVSATIDLPLTGTWSARCSVDGSDELSGTATLTMADGQVSFSGTVLRSGVVNGRVQVQVAGGAGRLTEVLPGKAYKGVPASVVVGDILDSVGETLSTSSDAALLALFLAYWIRRQGKAKDQLRELLDHIGAVRRALPDGTTWIGTETWPETELAEWVVIEERPDQRRLVIASDLPIVYPGETFEGQRIAAVRHMLDGAKLRTELQFEAEQGRAGLEAMVDEKARRMDYLAMYPGSVVKWQRSGGVDKLDVRMDDQRFGPGLTSIPLRTGIPGVLVEVPKGSRVLVGFENGSPSAPVAHLWQASQAINLEIETTGTVTIKAATAIELGAAATLGVARQTDTVQAGPFAGTITGGSLKVQAE